MPKVIKGNGGIFTVKINLPEGYDTSGINLETVTLNGHSAISGQKGYEQQASKGQYKFNREDFTWNEEEKQLEFRAEWNGQLVVGQTTVSPK